MEIKVKKQVEEIMRVELPYFCSSVAYTVGIFADNCCVVITHSLTYQGVEKRNWINNDWFTTDDYEECTEAEFLFQYYTASDNLNEIVKSNKMKYETNS